MRSAAVLPYDFEQSLQSSLLDSNSAAYVLAGLALTLCRWTGSNEASISFKGGTVHFVIDESDTVTDLISQAKRFEAGRVDAVDSSLVAGSDDLRRGQIELHTDVPDSEHGFVADVASAVDEFVWHPDGLVEDVRCIAPHRRSIIDGLAGTASTPTDILTLFSERVRSQPGDVAVRDSDGALTYADLEHASIRYAHRLRQAGVQTDDRVLIAARRSVGEVVALLAVLRLGAVYAGFDSDSPDARLLRIIEKLSPAVAVVDASTMSHPALEKVVRVMSWIHDREADLHDVTEELPPPPNDPYRAAYIAFTSGSTGEPKGVVVPNCAVSRLAVTPGLRPQPGDHVLRLAPLAFDASTYEIWVTLLNGATLQVFSARYPSVGTLGRFLQHNNVTVAWLTASLFRLIVGSRPEILGGLRWILTGGEVVSSEAVAQMLRMNPALTITNGYGPTENTTFTATYTISKEAEIDGPLPIGRPVSGTRVFVLDKNRRLVPPGGIGELYAAGIGLADGYLGDIAETAERFGRFSPDVNERLYRTGDRVRIDAAGNLQFLGRIDRQIKIHGHRIEVEEIRQAIIRDPNILDAVVTATQYPDRSPQLVAAVIYRSGTESDADPAALRRHLSKLLPNYAIPTLWALIKELPLTSNGKVDEKAIINQAVSMLKVRAS